MVETATEFRSFSSLPTKSQGVQCPRGYYFLPRCGHWAEMGICNRTLTRAPRRQVIADYPTARMNSVFINPV
jgi:hypothetical protein